MPSPPPVHPARILLTTFGSLGDLHPYIALALGLRQRGHDAIIATSGYYRQKIEALGLSFRPLRPDHPDPDGQTDLMRRVMDLHKGPEVVIRELMMPFLRDSYDDTLAAAEGVDLLVAHPLTFTTRLVAEMKGLPWASTLLAPLSFFSIHDPPVLAPSVLALKLRFLGTAIYGPIFRLMRRMVRTWGEPWHRLRAELGLPATKQDPLFEGQHSPRLVLALFSELLAARQVDWPPHTIVTGFPFYDRGDNDGLTRELACFLEEGPAPLVFTLGSSAVLDAGAFYEHSAAAAQQLGRRAVLVVGNTPGNRPTALTGDIIAVAYTPFSQLFPRAAAIVHQGGIGTTAQAMRAGRPMLVMPYAHDQPDNAERVNRLGIARVIPRRRYNARRASAELTRLLDDPGYAARAEAVGAEVRRVDGVANACAALESLLQDNGRELPEPAGTRRRPP